METVKYKTYKTTMGHKIRVRMTRQEIREKRILTALIWISPFFICWLFATVAGAVF